MSRQRVSQGKDSLVATEYFYVATELANVKRILVVTEYISHRDREFQNMGFPMSRHSALCHDGVARTAELGVLRLSLNVCVTECWERSDLP